jgi:hypothetical protein
MCLWGFLRVCAEEGSIHPPLGRIVMDMEYDALHTFNEFTKKILERYECAKNHPDGIQGCLNLISL